MKRLALSALAALAVLGLGGAAPVWSVKCFCCGSALHAPLWVAVAEVPRSVSGRTPAGALHFYRHDLAALWGLGLLASGAAVIVALVGREKAPPCGGVR